jgi:hypothetical protein
MTLLPTQKNKIIIIIIIIIIIRFEVKLDMKHILRILYALMINKPLLIGIPST